MDYWSLGLNYHCNVDSKVVIKAENLEMLKPKNQNLYQNQLPNNLRVEH